MLVRPLNRAMLDAEVAAHAQSQHDARNVEVDVVEIADVGLNYLAVGGKQCAYGWHSFNRGLAVGEAGSWAL